MAGNPAVVRAGLQTSRDDDAHLGARQPMDLAAFEAAVRQPTRPPHESRHPVLVRLLHGEFAPYHSLCEEHGIRLIDHYDAQLNDLAAVRLPGATHAERARLRAAMIEAAGDPAASGIWAFLPWSATVAHILGPDEYFEVITDRNHDKITRLEQQILRFKRVAVMGLSLGAEVAVTIAQEHLCGSIAIADFDRLDLSNLNRLNAGFDLLGLPKTTLAARRIAAIDPYIHVRIFDEGVHAANVAEFLEDVDLLLEESDGMEVKFDIRRVARDQGVNVAFAGDERGFLSVEPYGNEPDLEPFHGRVTAAQPPRDSFPSAAEFLRELTTWLGGWDEISPRTRSSLEQVGTSISGYPQLASETRFAAGQIGHVARRLLLGERLQPFIGHIDLDRILPSARAAHP